MTAGKILTGAGALMLVSAVAAWSGLFGLHEPFRFAVVSFLTSLCLLVIGLSVELFRVAGLLFERLDGGVNARRAEGAEGRDEAGDGRPV